MNISIHELTCKIIPISPKAKFDERMLANATVSMKDHLTGGYMTITGFSIWLSQIPGERYNVQVPKSKRGFAYVLLDKDLSLTLKQFILRKYKDYAGSLPKKTNL